MDYRKKVEEAAQEKGHSFTSEQITALVEKFKESADRERQKWATIQAVIGGTQNGNPITFEDAYNSEGGQLIFDIFFTRYCSVII